MIEKADCEAYHTKLISYFKNSNTKIHLQTLLDHCLREVRETFKYDEIICLCLFLVHGFVMYWNATLLS